MTGQQLKNGAVILLAKETDNPNHRIILAVFGHQFVTWLYDVRDNLTRIGNYFGNDLQAALDNFNER